MRRELRARVAVRAAKAAEKYGPPAQPLKPVDANAPAKRPRGRPPGSKNKRDSGTHPKTPALKAATEAKAAARAILSRPSAAKSGETRAREEVEDDAHARARRPAPAPAHAQAVDPRTRPGPEPRARGSAIGPFAGIRRCAPAGERPLAPRRAPTPVPRAATTTSMMSDDEITRRVVGGVGRYGCVGDGDLLGVSFPPSCERRREGARESHATNVSQRAGALASEGVRPRRAWRRR